MDLVRRSSSGAADTLAASGQVSGEGEGEDGSSEDEGERS
jgi:hypothetical protein